MQTLKAKLQRVEENIASLENARIDSHREYTALMKPLAKLRSLRDQLVSDIHIKIEQDYQDYRLVCSKLTIRPLTKSQWLATVYNNPEMFKVFV